MESNESIGARMAALRKKAGMTQVELAKKVYVSRERVVQWEQGTRELKAGIIAGVTDALGTTCDFLLRGIDTNQLDAHADLGLSSEAIECLRLTKEPVLTGLTINGAVIRKAVNSLLATAGGVEALRLIGIYLAGDFSKARALRGGKIEEDGILDAVSVPVNETTFYDVPKEMISEAILLKISEILREIKIKGEKNYAEKE